MGSNFDIGFEGLTLDFELVMEGLDFGFYFELETHAL